MNNGKYVWMAKVGDKGQIVIPKEARDVFDIKNGDTLVLFGDITKGIAITKNDDCIKFAQRIFEGQEVCNNDNDK